MEDSQKNWTRRIWYHILTYLRKGEIYQAKNEYQKYLQQDYINL